MTAAQKYYSTVERMANFTIKVDGWNISKYGKVIDETKSFCFIEVDGEIFKINKRNVYFS